MRRSELRAKVFELAGGRCEFPGCPKAATELAHLHSIGAGGRKSADTLDNTMAACPDHARITDGLYGTGGREQFEKAMRSIGAAGAWERAEALRKHVLQTRGFAV